MIKFALLGCGRISKIHSELLGLNQIKKAKLVAVCDIVKEKAKLLGEKFDVPYFIEFEDMLNNVDIDIIVVLTESGNHAKDVIQLSKYKKHIIVEKPMALNLKDADAMIEACKKNKIKIFVVKQNRFNLPIIKLKETLDSGRFGKLILGTVRVRWCRLQDYYDQDPWRGTVKLDGGVIGNQASHHVDLLCWMMGDISSVYALASKALAKIESYDTVTVNLRFKNGALGLIEATTATRPKDLEGSISILGENGSVVVEGFAVNKMKVWSFNKFKKSDREVIKKYSENPPNVYGFGHKSFYNNVVDNILKNSDNNDNFVNFIHSRKTVQLICAINKSIETRKPVYI
jgi:predicted dehydrogenase